MSLCELRLYNLNFIHNIIQEHFHVWKMAKI